MEIAIDSDDIKLVLIIISVLYKVVVYSDNVIIPKSISDKFQLSSPNLPPAGRYLDLLERPAELPDLVEPLGDGDGLGGSSSPQDGHHLARNLVANIVMS